MSEVDAATYSKVEQVRELTENLKYGPAHDRYKVAVLDEVHRLSRQAFDALLKIVEEPPPSSSSSSPPPRPTPYRDHPVALPGVPLPPRSWPGALRLSAGDLRRRGDHRGRHRAASSPAPARGACRIRWRCSTSSPPSARDDRRVDAARLLGGLDSPSSATCWRRSWRRREAVGGLVGRLEDEGWDPRHAYSQLLAYCRDALHLAMSRDGGDPEQGRPAGRGGGGPRRHRARGGLREPPPLAPAAAGQREHGAPQRNRRPRPGDRAAPRRRAAQADPRRGAAGGNAGRWRGAAAHREARGGPPRRRHPDRGPPAQARRPAPGRGPASRRRPRRAAPQPLEPPPPRPPPSPPR